MDTRFLDILGGEETPGAGDIERVSSSSSACMHGKEQYNEGSNGSHDHDK